MRLKILVLASCLVGPLVAARPASGGATVRSIVLPWCVSTTDSVAQRLVVQLTELASATSSDGVTMRDSLAHMPMTPANEIDMVGDKALCHQASQMLDSVFFISPQSKAVYLARVGNRYAVYPPGIMMGEFSYMIFTDSAFKKLVTMAW
jgi:hypothetical protein